MKSWLAIFCTLLIAPPALALDRNTVDSVVYIEHDEVGFLYIGNRKARRLSPGMHIKVPLLERVGVIIPDKPRSGYTALSVALATGERCEIDAWLEYTVTDPRRAFNWRRANKLPLHQQRELFKYPREDYTEPARTVEAAFRTAAESMTRRQLACGAFETWHALGSTGLTGNIGADGTEILETGLSESCADDLRAAMAGTGPQCHLSPPLSKSFSSSAQDNPHRTVRHQTQR